MPDNNMPDNNVPNHEITQTMIDESYKVAVQVFDNIISKQKGIEYLTKNIGMNARSASDYIENYKCLRSGTVYRRTMNKNATKTYLQNIYDDLGVQGLQTALQAVEQHRIYYESLGHGKLPSIQAVYSQFAGRLQAVCKDASKKLNS